MLCSIFLTVAAYAQTTKVLGRKVAGGGGGSYTDIVHFQTFEANDNTGDYNFTTGEYPSGRAGTYGLTGADQCDADADEDCNNTASVKVGTYGYEFWEAAGGEAYMGFLGNAPPIATINIGMWYRSVGSPVSQRLWTSYQGTGNFEVKVTSNGQIECSYNDGTNEAIVSSAASSIAADTWYFVTCAADTTVATSIVKVTTRPSGGSVTTLTGCATGCDQTTADPAAGSGWAGFYFGNSSSNVTHGYIDNLMISDSYSRNFDADLGDGTNCSGSTPLRDCPASPR